MLDWNSINTVLLDMDGTLIDQRLDNHFFHDFIPELIAKRDDCHIDTVRENAMRLYDQYAGRLEFYCLDFWSQQFNLDLHALTAENP